MSQSSSQLEPSVHAIAQGGVEQVNLQLLAPEHVHCAFAHSAVQSAAFEQPMVHGEALQLNSHVAPLQEQSPFAHSATQPLLFEHETKQDGVSQV